MRGLTSVRPSDAPRLRRWDVVVLGGALPGLVAAVRLGQRGARVLVIEEATALDGFFGLREPFLLTGSEREGVLGACLLELGLPLIDRRRFVESEIAVQIATPDARIDFGRAPMALAEITAWGFVKPEAGRALLEAFGASAQAERENMLAAPIVKSPRLRWPGQAGLAAPRRRETHRVGGDINIPETLRPVLEGLARALADTGEPRPAPESVARLVGGLLFGAAALHGEEAGLRGMLRRRIEALLGEFRRTGEDLELLTVGGNPAVGLKDPVETCGGRVLVLNAPLAGIAAACGDRTPAALLAARPERRRVSLHYRGEASALPEGMGERLVSVSRPGAGDDRAIVTLQVFAGEDRRGRVDLIASAVGPAQAESREAIEDWIRRTVRNLIPFSEQSLESVRAPEVTWDDDALRGAPAGSRRWPRPAEIRLSQRPAIFTLDRDAVAPLGLEGDLLLGWRAGDAIADGLG